MKTGFRRMAVATAIMLSGGMAFAQSSTMTMPNNSAGTVLDTPPLIAPPSMATTKPTSPSRTDSSLSAFDKLDPRHQGYVTRSDVSELPGTINFDEADRNRDGRLDSDEFQRFWQDYNSPGGQ
jgi:Ca2+-binding EF-hand superfamily protein